MGMTTTFSRPSSRALFLALLFATAPAALRGQSHVTTPVAEFGHEIGADYVLPDYTQLLAYWQKLATQSERMVLDTIGTTAEGRPQVMAIITAPENQRRLEHFREIARRLARAEDVSEAEARRLAAEGRAVVWIDGGLHATEVLGAQQLMETVWQLVSREDPETLRILSEVIVLAVHANPDGMELVSDWYMRNPEPTARSTAGVPRLYQKYIGHDNNRDFYASTQAETENLNRVMYTEWFPQIMYNHHQTGPAGTVMFAPPFRDPFNYHFDPLIPVGIDLVAAAMHNRFIAEDKPGVTMRGGANYSTWWNGGLRTTAYFHNMIGLLTETIGNPTPQEIPFIATRQLPRGDLPAPVAPQRWHFRQSIDYSVSANYAVLDVAARYRDQFLFNIWRMGRNAIERGSRDSWTAYPRRVLAAQRVLADSTRTGSAAAQAGSAAPAGTNGPPPLARGTAADFERLLRDPADRDARGYIIPGDQADFLTAAKFVDALLETGVAVHRATADFTVNGRRYPAGSFVVRTAQAFRPHVLDMFEPQDHPDDVPYPGGPPTPPYDNAGWTLAYQMGIAFDRVLDGFEGPFEPIAGLRAPRPEGRVAGRARAGWLLDRAVNDAFSAVNRLLAGGAEVYALERAVRAGGATHPAGTFFIRNGAGAAPRVAALARELGLDFRGIDRVPGGEHQRLRAPRIALWDRYGGSMESGWTRWLLEQFDFGFDVVHPRALDAGNLRARYDVLVLPNGSVPLGPPRTGAGAQPDTSTLTPELRALLGTITADRTGPQLRAFLEQGGTILTIGTGGNLVRLLELPLESALVEEQDGQTRPLPRAKFYVPGSILQVRLDPTHPLTRGMPERADVFFDNSPVFRATGGSAAVRPIAWFEGRTPLRSGWALGQEYLEDGIAAAELRVGAGRVLVFGPEIAFRAQPHGTFKLLFNGLYLASAEGPQRIR